ncbi:site-specific integrase [uncultured Clostridium sp.]|uniref:site-specific integrase n=1 Tax=uncultured Clostridium sp. TaxID=59620 RepID=UPI0025CE5410|nr:site-specific integrase [uncultured Clostridium sp.]
MNLEYNITYRQKDKGWQYIISYKINGKWKQKSKQGFKTKKDAKPAAEKEALNLIKSFKNEIVSPDYDSITFKKLSDVFIDHLQLYRENNTIEAYRYSINAFNELDSIKIKDIKKIHIQNIVDKFIKNDSVKVSTIRTYLIRIKKIFKYYVENYDPSYIVFDKITLPEIKENSNKKAITKTELDNLLKTLKEKHYGKYYIAALIAGTCGLRCGEVLGLTWNSIDSKKSELNITQQWKKDKKTKKYSFGSLKGTNSYRTIPISKFVLNELLEYKKVCITDINNRIVPCTDSSIKKYLNPYLKEISNISIHELRHTYATLLISNGIDFKTAAKLLGHDVQQTLKTYSHVTDDMLKKATETITQIF